MLRRTLAGSLVFLGVVALNLGAIGWWFDREVADADRISELATAVSRSPEFQQAVASELTDTFVEAAGESGAGPLDNTEAAAIADAAAAAMEDSQVLAIVRTAFVDLYQAATEFRLDEISLDIAPIRDALVRGLTPVDPELAAQIERTQIANDEVTVATDELPDLRSLTDRLHLAWMLQLGFGAAAVGLALAIHPRRFVLVRRVGVLMALGAGLQIGLTMGLSAILERFGPDDRLFVGVSIAADLLMESLRIQAYVQLTLAVVVAAGGHILLWTRRLVPRMVPRLA